jgi:DNA repair protein SbcD/Mre11
VKLLHTADWHVGKMLRGQSRADEHVAVLDEIAGQARAEDVDIVIVAGDLFDSAAPSPESEKIVYHALLQLAETGATLVIIAGNHDNERRLTAIAPLLELKAIIVRPTPAPPGGGGVVDIETRSGEPVKLALLPWLSHRHVVKADQLMAHDAPELTGHYRDRTKRIIEALSASFSDDAINVFVGHLTIPGGELGGGERTAQTIFDYYVDVTAFPAGAHYVALGHLHKLQKMAGPCPIHYCGSPLQLDFSDTDDAKATLVVDASPRSPAKVKSLELAAGRSLRTLEGTLDELAAHAADVGDAYLRVKVRGQARVGLADEVRNLLPNTVDVIVVPDDGREDRDEEAARRAELSPHDLFVEYLREKNALDRDVVALFDRVLEEKEAPV